MKKYSKEIDEFLRKKILPVMNIEEYNEENISDIVEYMFNEIESPLCNAEENGEILTNEKSELLRLTTKAITEITTRDDWK